MAGFLTRIAARLDGGSEGTLRPRTRSLFEPVATAAFTPAGDAAAAKQQLPATAFERADEVDAPAVAAPSPVAARVSSSRDRRSGTSAVAATSAALNRADSQPQLEPGGEPPATRAASRAPRGQAQPAAMIEPVPDPESQATRDAPASPGASTAIRPAGRVASPRAMPAHPVRGIDPIDEIAARPVVVRRGTIRPSSPRSDASRPAADDRGDMTAAASPPTAGATGVLQAPVVARLVSEPLLSTGRAPQTAVHVTIGRVEVRAVAASPPDRARLGRPPPVMSLDEYLRTRAR